MEEKNAAKMDETAKAAEVPKLEETQAILMNSKMEEARKESFAVSQFETLEKGEKYYCNQQVETKMKIPGGFDA